MSRTVITWAHRSFILASLVLTLGAAAGALSDPDPRVSLDRQRDIRSSQPESAGAAGSQSEPLLQSTEPTGACCFGTSCNVAPESFCYQARGSFQGDGTICAPNICPPRLFDCPPGDFTQDNGLNSLDIQGMVRVLTGHATSSCELAMADVTGDGVVGLDDVQLWIAGLLHADNMGNTFFSTSPVACGQACNNQTQELISTKDKRVDTYVVIKNEGTCKVFVKQTELDDTDIVGTKCTLDIGENKKATVPGDRKLVARCDLSGTLCKVSYSISDRAPGANDSKCP